MILKTTFCLAALTASLTALPVFIGTNTGKNSTSKGIYTAEFDPASGKLSDPQLAAQYGNPGFLTQHPTLPVLYAVGSPNKPFLAAMEGLSSVAAFAIAADHQLKFLGEASTGGKDACHLAVDATGHSIAVANYGDGHITTLSLDAKGLPENKISIIANNGSGPNKSRQDGPHAHGVYFDKSNTHLFVPDLGLDMVLVYPFDPATGKPGLDLPALPTAPGAGPRHLAFSSDGKFAYVINELDSTVLAASYHDGKFTTIGTVPMLINPDCGQTGAEIEVSPDDRFVYASSRGDDEIFVFRRNQTSGRLSFVQRAPCGGKAPRHFKIAPGGKWLLCAHQSSNTISVLPVNVTNGELGAPAHTVACPTPICILFAR